MTGRTKRRPGAPAGNQNARKHGFYSKALSPWQQSIISKAADVDSVGLEVVVLRAKIASILANDPGNTKVLTMALTSLASLLRTNQRLGSRQTRALDAATDIVSRLISQNNHARNDTPQEGLIPKFR